VLQDDTNVGIGTLAVKLKMAQFIVAIGLVLVIEGLLFAAFPRAAKRLAASAVESPETSLRIAGIVSAVLGIVVIWFVRG
jgi:uncharacterized protein YjeT (DUF2065 family)